MSEVSNCCENHLQAAGCVFLQRLTGLHLAAGCGNIPRRCSAAVLQCAGAVLQVSGAALHNCNSALHLRDQSRDGDYRETGARTRNQRRHGGER